MSENNASKNCRYSFTAQAGKISAVSTEKKSDMQPTAESPSGASCKKTPEPADQTPYTWDIMPPPRCRVKLRRRHRWFKVLFTLFLLTATTLCVMFFMAAEYHSAVTVHGSEQPLQTREILHLMRQKFARNTTAGELRIELTEDELNAYLPGVFDKLNSGYREELQINGCWKKGCFEGTASIYLCRMYWNIRFSANILWQNNSAQLAVRNARLGKLPLPATLLKRIEKRIIAALEADPDYQQIMQGITGISVTPDGSLQITLNIDAPQAPDYEKNPVIGDFSGILIGKILMPMGRAKSQNKSTFTAKLTPHDVNVLFAHLINASADAAVQDNEPQFYALCQNGQIGIYTTIINKHKVPLVVYLAVIPEIKNGDLFIAVNDVRIGNLQLPAKLLETQLKKHLALNTSQTGYIKIIQLCSLEKDPADQKKAEFFDLIRRTVKNLQFDEQGNWVLEGHTDHVRGIIQRLL